MSGFRVARPERFELPTLCFEGRCSIQLSYGRNFIISSLRCSLPLFQGAFGAIPASTPGTATKCFSKQSGPPESPLKGNAFH